MTKIEQYERAMRSNIASAEREIHDHEHKRGFIIGAVATLWQVYQEEEVDMPQFDQLIEILSGFSNGSYRQFIGEMVRDYKAGNPPIIVGY